MLRDNWLPTEVAARSSCFPKTCASVVLESFGNNLIICSAKFLVRTARSFSSFCILTSSFLLERYLRASVSVPASEFLLPNSLPFRLAPQLGFDDQVEQQRHDYDRNRADHQQNVITRSALCWHEIILHDCLLNPFQMS